MAKKKKSSKRQAGRGLQRAPRKRKSRSRRLRPVTRKIKGYTYRRKKKLIRVRSYRRKKQKRLRQIAPLVGWETIDRWKSELEHDFRGIDIPPIPALLKWVTPTGETYFMSFEKHYPPRPGLYVIVVIFLVVENLKTHKKFMWVRAKQLGTGLLSPDDNLQSAAEDLADDISNTVENGTDYLQVRKLAGWTVTEFKKHEKSGAWFRRTRRGAHGKKRGRRKASQ